MTKHQLEFISIKKDSNGKIIEETELVSLEQNGDKAGSNEGYFAKSSDNKKYYVKFPSPAIDASAETRIKAEILAGELYKLAGVTVPNLTLVKEGDKLGIASELFNNFKQAKQVPLKITEIKNSDELLDGFIIDAWLANWDVVGLQQDNIGMYYDEVDKIDKLARIDTGGALDYRANPNQYNPKQTCYKSQKYKYNFDKEVSDIKSINPQFFANIQYTNFVNGAIKLAKIKDEQIRELVELYDPKDPNYPKDKLADILIARKNTIVKEYVLQTENELKSESTLTTESKLEDIASDIITKFYIKAHPGDTCYIGLYKKEGIADIPKNPIERVKHGGMHVSRVALAVPMLIKLQIDLKLFNEKQIKELTPRLVKLLQIGALFHDSGREIDDGADQHVWEENGIKKFETYANNLGYSSAEIKEVADAIRNKDKLKSLNGKPLLLASIIHNVDSLDAARSHSWDYSPKYLSFHSKLSGQSLNTFNEFLDSYKNFVADMGDNGKALKLSDGTVIDRKFDLSIKKKYEHASNCFAAITSLMEAKHKTLVHYLKSDLKAEKQDDSKKSLSIPKRSKDKLDAWDIATVLIQGTIKGFNPESFDSYKQQNSFIKIMQEIANSKNDEVKNLKTLLDKLITYDVKPETLVDTFDNFPNSLKNGQDIQALQAKAKELDETLGKFNKRSKNYKMATKIAVGFLCAALLCICTEIGVRNNFLPQSLAKLISKYEVKNICKLFKGAAIASGFLSICSMLTVQGYNNYQKGMLNFQSRKLFEDTIDEGYKNLIKSQQKT